MSITTVAPDVGDFVRDLFRDLKRSQELGREQARWLTDMYYQIQDYRIQSASQVRQSEGEPCAALDTVYELMRVGEQCIKANLGRFASSYSVGQWCQSIVGIGPVITAGMLSHLDIRRAPTAGHFWAFAGLDPTRKWEKKQKRPWNAKLKTLCWKLGESFIKVQTNSRDVYGKLYRERKDREIERNDAGAFAAEAAQILKEKTFRKTTKAYKHYSAGKLPPAHLHARARRFAVKLWLSHLHHVMHVDVFGVDPPKPFALEHIEGHVHMRGIPNWPCEMSGKSLRELS